jgi:hypothetical protein
MRPRTLSGRFDRRKSALTSESVRTIKGQSKTKHGQILALVDEDFGSVRTFHIEGGLKTVYGLAWTDPAIGANLAVCGIVCFLCLHLL